MDDLTNRILTVGAALLWIFFIVLVIFLVWGAPDQGIERLNDLAGYLDDHNTTEAKLIITFGGVILILLATLLIIFEVVPPESGSLKVEKVGAGEAHIGTDEAVLRLEEELRTIPQVSEVQAAVTGRGRKAEVNLILHVAADADLAATVDEACRRARALLEERMGVALTRPPRAEVHYRELRVGRALRVGQPQEPAPPAVSPPASSLEPAPAPAEPPLSMESTHETTEPREDRPADA